MDHDLGVFQCKAAVARCQQHGTHAGSLPQAVGVYFVAAAAHDIVDCQAIAHHTARTIDVQADRLVPRLGVQVEQCADDDLGLPLVDFAVQKDDALLQKGRADIPAAAQFVFYNRYGLHKFLLVVDEVPLEQVYCITLQYLHLKNIGRLFSAEV